MITTIIFSKDRACQLDLLLSTLEDNFKDISTNIKVLSYASNENYWEGYQKVAENFPNATIFDETNFQEDTIGLLKCANKYVCFFVDDNILYRKPELEYQHIDALLSDVIDAGCFSLRLGRNTNIQDPYTKTPVNPMPNFVAIRFHSNNIGLLAWNWTMLPMNNFGYPFSVDGHIYNTDLILKSLDYDFDTPNAFEGRFKAQNIPPIMFCLEKSCVFNTPLNLVGSSQNAAGRFFGRTLEELNSAFLNGKRLRLKDFDPEQIVGCHQEWETEYV